MTGVVQSGQLEGATIRSVVATVFHAGVGRQKLRERAELQQCGNGVREIRLDVIVRLS